MSMALVFVFVCSKDKTTKPPPREDPGYYYPRQEKYRWVYAKGCDASASSDSSVYTILRATTRHGDVGFDRCWNADTSSIIFLFVKADTLFLEKVGQGVPLLKILVGPIRAGTYWRDQNFEYLIQGFENVTLTITGVTYNRCAKIIKTHFNSPNPNVTYEWWVPQYGLVKWIEVDTLDVCQSAEELRYFSTGGVFP
jgi:hypothetical protein